MKLILLALTCIALGLVIIACTETVTPTNTSTPRAAASPASAASPADELAAARANYTKNCEPCHQANGEGGLVKVDNKQIKVASLKAEHAMKHTDEKLIKTITNGQEEMPSFKNKLKPEEISELVKYIRKTYQGK